uniref:ATP synthase complex subunit 8 n=1 Tax=Pristimantis thymelensis TaxID=248790 RepID=S4V1B1_9NEOB|nr:ATP synthase F0 subunit 8 [Pristimantis thymelensis]
MPQLNPSPWFFILLLSWFLLIVIMPIKITGFHHLNDPSLKTHQPLNKPWPWPWF